MDDEKSRSYADYFIVDGKHIGDYEGMYQNAIDPWRIEELGFRLDMRAALLLLTELPLRPERVLDLGAGAGLFSLELYRALKAINPEVSLTLSDISPTALRIARERFNRELSGAYEPICVTQDLRLLDSCFEERTKDEGAEVEASKDKGTNTGSPPFPFLKVASYDLVVMAQTLWGVMENLMGTFRGIRKLIAPRGALLISQHFPGEKNQRYGREITRPEDLMDLLGNLGFSLLRTIETDRLLNHHWGALWRKL
jgi:SAM-dependent methyltransferase